MDFADRRTVQQLLKKYGVSPKRHLGQNFLVSGRVVRRIVAAADVQKDETILEIGGGLGALTLPLAKQARKVIVYERDAALCRGLSDLLASFANVELRCADARTILDRDLPKGPYRLIANLPYGVGTIVLRTLWEQTHAPKEAIAMLQKDVAERICAKPPKMHMLSVAIQSLATPKIVFRIPPRASWPIPEVESALIRLIPKTPRIEKTQYQTLMALARLGFAHPRKKAIGNLARHFEKARVAQAVSACGIAPNARAQELALSDWQCFTRYLDRV